MPANEPDTPLLDAARNISGKLDEVSDKVDGLIATKRQQTTAMQAQTRELGRHRKAGWLLFILIGLVAVALVLGGWALLQVKSTNRCLTVVVAATADRTGVLAPLATARTRADQRQTSALTQLVLDAVPQPGKPFDRDQYFRDGSVYRQAVAAYQKADQAYQEAYVAHPPPPPPSKAC
jgi:hypothetical protein